MRVHLNKEYFIVEKDGILVVGIMDADELEDYLELQDHTVKEFIAESHKDYLAGHTRPAMNCHLLRRNDRINCYLVCG